MIDRQFNYTPQIVKKSNFLIQRSNTLPFCIQKNFNLMLLEVQKQGTSNKEFKIPVNKFLNLIGQKLVYRTVDYFEKVGEKLITHIVKLIDKTDNALDLTSLITRFRLEGGYIYFKITDEFRAFADLDFVHADGEKTIKKGYTPIDLNIGNSFKNKHSIPLYEYHLMQLCYLTSPKHIKNKNEVKFFICIDKLKLLLCKDSKSYINNTNLFKFKVLDKSIKEVNQKSDITLEYTPVKSHDNKTIIGFDCVVKAKDEYRAVKAEKSLIQSIIQPVKDIFKAPEKKPQLAARKEAENLPEPIAQAKEWGYKNINQLMQAYNGGLDKRRQIIAILTEVSFKYSDKTNDEKCRLLACLIKKDAFYQSPAEIEEENKLQLEQEQKAKIKQIEIEAQKQKILQEVKKQTEKEIIKQNNREVFENEIAKENSQLSQIWKAITKAVELNIPIQQVRTWFNPAIAKIEDNTLHIALPNRFKVDFFRNNLLRYVNQALQSINLNINVKVSL